MEHLHLPICNWNSYLGNWSRAVFEQCIHSLPILGLVRAVCFKQHFPPLSLFLPPCSTFPAPATVWHQIVPTLNTAAIYCWVITSALSQNIIITALTGILQQQPCGARRERALQDTGSGRAEHCTFFPEKSILRKLPGVYGHWFRKSTISSRDAHMPSFQNAQRINAWRQWELEDTSVVYHGVVEVFWGWQMPLQKVNKMKKALPAGP